MSGIRKSTSPVYDDEYFRALKEMENEYGVAPQYEQYQADRPYLGQRKEVKEMTRTLYECGICGALHPWEWNGDCRSNPDRYADEEDFSHREGVPYEDIEVRSMEERVEADMRGRSN